MFHRCAQHRMSSCCACCAEVNWKLNVVVGLTVTVFAASVSLLASAHIELNGCDLSCTGESDGAVQYSDDGVYTCGGKVGCEEGLKQLYYLKVVIGIGVLVFWLILAASYAYLLLCSRVEGSANTSTKDIEAARADRQMEAAQSGVQTERAPTQANGAYPRLHLEAPQSRVGAAYAQAHPQSANMHREGLASVPKPGLAHSQLHSVNVPVRMERTGAAISILR